MGFLQFPLVTAVEAARGPTFAWLVRQGENNMIMFARAPGFTRTKLFSRTDADGQPITDIWLSPEGRHIVFQTAADYGGEKGYNPASLIEPPQPTLWIIEVRAGAKPMRIGAGVDPAFSPSGDQLLYRHAGDLWLVALDAKRGEPKLLAKGGAAFGQSAWTPDGKALVFVQDRGGYSFLGRYRLGAPAVEWLVTGVDRLASPVLSPDGRSIAYRRLRGREHDVIYDFTESEPLAIDLLDIATGKTRTLWEAREKAAARAEDTDSALRWVGNDHLVFHSEHDGWGRLYAIARSGGDIRPLTPANCEVAESESVGTDLLLAVHNCRDIDTRQLSLIDVRTGQERPLKIDDLVAANATGAEGSRYLAYSGGDADNSPLLRVLDLNNGQIVMREQPSDYGYRHVFAAPDPKAVRIKAADGGTVPAQLFLPAGKGPHPALVYVHGGPSRQMFPAFHHMGYYANDYAINRALAEQGYVVLSLNYRSGIGYGRAFREAAKRGWRGASEYQDVLGAGRWLAARNDVDHDRIGIWGGSYGGLLTAQALARDSDLFKAGVAVHGVFDWSWPTSREGHLNPSRVFGVGPDDRPTAFKASPLGAIDGWRSPVLLFTGDQDMNVDVLETVDLAQKLRDRKVDVRAVILPGEAHDFVRQSSYIRLWNETLHFFNETLSDR